MTEIATIEEFAYALRLTVEEAEDHVLLLDLAEGLVAEILGEMDPWPVSAKAVVLAAAARAFFNPAGVKSETLGRQSRSFDAGQMGVYLTDEELDRLRHPNRGPSFSFPGTWPYPDPVERPADIITS